MLLQAVRNWIWLQRAQWFDRQKLHDIQGRRLRAMVRHAHANVPFFARLYSDAGIDPSVIQDVRDLGKLPTITKRQVREAPLKERMALGTDPASCIIRTTSGSTGMPITFLDDQYSASYRIALWLRRFWNFGIRPRDKAFVVVPGEHRASTLSQTKGLIGAVLRWKVRRMSLSDDMEDHVGQILKWKPNVIVGPPSYFRSVVEIANESRVQLSARVAVVCGELLDRTTRDRISGELGADVFETYGVSEVGGIAWECPSRSGYHLNSDSSIIELLQDGEHVAEGESGEVCVTNLWRKPTPLIRYRVGDMASYLGDDCSCGRGLPLIKNLQGRIIDFVITRGGKPISPFRVMFMMEGFPAIGQYKVVQRSDYSIEVSVRTVEKPFEAVRPALENECKQLFEDTPFTITDKEKFEVTRGDKFRVVESEIKR